MDLLYMVTEHDGNIRCKDGNPEKKALRVADIVTDLIDKQVLYITIYDRQLGGEMVAVFTRHAPIVALITFLDKVGAS